MITLPGYKITDKIHEGRNSDIYQGIRELENIPVIIKLLNKENPSSNQLAHFKQEYKIAYSLTVDGTIKIYGMEEYENSLAIIMEDFGGESLKKIFSEHKLELKEKMSLVIKITEGLSQIHQQSIIHKDINPSNIIWNTEKEIIKIIDFGISTELSREITSLKGPNILEGTIAYISPEQTGRMNRAIDYRTDFYSLGVTFYWMLTGRLPFETKDLMERVHSHIAIQPVPPHEIDEAIPQMISSIVMKLMAKNAEDRYLSALGLKADLEKCQQELQDKKDINPFVLGQKDVSDRFQIPQKLYGREQEIQILMSAFERVSEKNTELMLVSGFSGIGKSMLVNEIHKPIVKCNGYFVSGKFEQLKKDVPYSAIIQAFTELAKQILAEDETKINKWKETILSALGSNSRIVTDVIPLFELIIGKQQETPVLGTIETKNRFNLVFQDFIKALATQEHPLVMFLDDLQWADLASLQLLKMFLANADTQHFLTIGAFRHNETSDSHPLMLTVDEIKESNVRVNNISLQPLNVENINELLGDTLNLPQEQTTSLVELLIRKTNGNPFFVNELLLSLYKENLFEFSFENGWSWDMNGIEKMQVTDNVVDLMAGKITDLPENSQDVLKLGACIGHYFDLATLVAVSKMPEEDILLALNDVLQEGMLNRIDNVYKFSHDRVLEASYSLLPDKEKVNQHYYIGNLELSKTNKEELPAKLFYIVNQLNAGIELVTKESDKKKLTELNLMAGKKSLASNAYASALNHLNIGIGLLEKSSWQTNYKLTLELYQEAAAAAQLSADYETLEKFADEVFLKAKTILDKIKVYEAKILACLAQNQLLEGIRIGLYILKQLGIKMPENPSKLQIIYELLITKLSLIGKPIENFLNLPKIKDPHKLAIMRILSGIGSSAYYANPELAPLIILKSLRLSIKYGNSDYSPYSYVCFGMINCGIFGDINNGYKWGKLSLDTVKKYNIKENKIKAMSVTWYLVNHWKRSLRESLQPLLETYQTGLEIGDLEFAATSAHCYTFNLFVSGIELIKVEKENIKYIEIVEKLNQDTVLNYILMRHQAILNLQGISDDPCKLIGESYDENKMLPIHTKANDSNAIFYLYYLLLNLNYLFGNYNKALKDTELVKPLCAKRISHPILPIINFYNSLTQLALCTPSNKSAQKKHLKVVAKNQKKMKKWAFHCPANYSHKYHLVEAEIASVLGKELNARKHYNLSIKLAHKNKFLQEEALSYELYAKFLRDKEEDEFARLMMTKSHQCYTKWGAKAKVDHLEKNYPDLLVSFNETTDRTRSNETVTIHNTSTSTAQILDISTITKASQALSGIIKLDTLLEEMLKLIVENAGADKGIVILKRNKELLIEAVSNTNSSKIKVLKSIPINKSENLSKNIVNYVVRTNKSVVLPDEKDNNLFINDPYILKNSPKSVLCIPMRHMDKTTGILYLENSVTENAFTKERIETLRILLSQAVISLENAYVYANLDNLVKERTSQLEAAQAELVENAHKAGMADIATGTLHNIGNILNSVKISTQIINDTSESSVLAGYKKANTLLKGNIENIKDFITNNPKGEKLLQYYLELENVFNEENATIKNHSKRLLTKVDAIAEVLAAQQSYAGTASLTEQCSISDLIEDALTMQQESLAKYSISIEKDFSDMQKIPIQKTKLIHLLINLINNAKEAMIETPAENRKLTFMVYSKDEKAYIKVKDTGIGILPEIFNKIFTHGFTTKEGGHGFGLHSCANYMTEMNGKMWVESDGENKGAAFVLEFPIK